MSSFQGGKSYEQLKEELGVVASPVSITPVCKKPFMLHRLSFLWFICYKEVIKTYVHLCKCYYIYAAIFFWLTFEAFAINTRIDFEPYCDFTASELW